MPSGFLVQIPFGRTTMQLTIEIVYDLIKDQGSLKISKKLLTDFILMNSRGTKAVQTTTDATHVCITLYVPAKTIPLSETNIANAFKSLFEFSSDSRGKVDMNDEQRPRISTKRDFETPWLTASCAISKNLTSVATTKSFSGRMTQTLMPIYRVRFRMRNPTFQRLSTQPNKAKAR